MKFIVLSLVIVAVYADAEAPLFAQPGLQRLEQPNQRYSLVYRLSERLEAPKPVYGAPSEEIPPEVSTEADVTTTETPRRTTDSTSGPENLKDKEELNENLEEGVYYVYHPTGLLQKIVYSTNNDLRNMAYKAEFKYVDVEPISDPIYTYDPETQLLRQIA